MIRYNTGSFGFKLLFRFHGSAVFKSLTPALISTGIYFVLRYTLDVENDPLFDHPYPMGALIAALTFLLAFRASFAYNRYWEAFAAVHQMHSKWIDVGVEFAAFHMQAKCFDPVKPPAFGAHPEVKAIERQRERNNEFTLDELEEQLESLGFEHSFRSQISTALCCKKNQPPAPAAPSSRRRRKQRNNGGADSKFSSEGTLSRNPTACNQEEGVVRTVKDKSKRAWEEGKPPLFLEEAAHLLSLLSAVACSTLRNDLEEADSPLTTFTRGRPWPCVDPDDYTADVRKGWTSSSHKSYTILRYLLGISRTPASRTLYNAARPFRVVGGVSDGEVALLQAARGPTAKVALCFLWLNEFISREYLAGSTGDVAPPIISRMYQFASDGMLGYNQARKVAYIPFPFPHAQITSLFVFVVVGFMPLLLLAYVANYPYAVVLNFVTVMSFAGLHEVARELENPFLNVPNDLPLNNYQAQFNEALMTMFAGYHPDAYWELVQEGDYDPTAKKKNETADQGQRQQQQVIVSEKKD